MGFEPTTASLEGRNSTTELLAATIGGTPAVRLILATWKWQPSALLFLSKTLRGVHYGDLG